MLGLAAGGDPIETIERLARNAVLKAMDEGWSGPPFNPVQLARHLGLLVEADGNVRDAQTVPTETGFKIKFNPTQTRERQRFSIAHEVAHTLFPDCADAVRNRGGDKSITDDWQIEVLCNIAAAEFVMPLGSLSPLDKAPHLEQLLVDRRQFDVSAEAYLIRVAKISNEPLIMFAASSRTHRGILDYRFDYCVASLVWDAPLPTAESLSSESIVGRCRSIGHTEHGVESIPGIGQSHIEAVGVPGFPGDRLPRVVGLLRAEAPHRSKPYEVVHGDVLETRGKVRRIVCQLVNDQARVWGGGVARSAAMRWPAAQQAFADWCNSVARSQRLGRVHVWSDQETILASLVAQHGLKASHGPLIRYGALSRCLDEVARIALEERVPVHMPRIGTGAAGGDWKVVEQLVLETLVGKGVAVTIVEPPPRRHQRDLFN